MLLTETQQSWQNIIKESFGVTNQERLNWMSTYAQIHNAKEINEAQQVPGNPVSAGLFATPLNTLGLGNPMMPQANQYGQSQGMGNTGSDFHNPGYQVGSGDIPNTTLPIAMTIAAQTIGFDLVPVVPAAGPVAWLQYFDTPYAGGKLGAINETVLDGVGEGTENKPIYIKVKSTDLAALEKLSNKVTDATDTDPKKVEACGIGAAVTITSANGTISGTYLGNSRIDNGILVKISSVTCGDEAHEGLPKDAEGKGPKSPLSTKGNTSIANVFSDTITAFTIDTITVKGTVYPAATGLETEDLAAISLYPELVGGNDDHVQEFQNFSQLGDPDEPMTRAENETGVGNTVGAKMFTKMVQMGAYEVTGTVTRQQLQDMPLYGIDVVGKVIEQMQNRISQAINNRILDRLFKLGVTNARTQYFYQGINLNMDLGTGDGASEVSGLIDINGNAFTEAKAKQVGNSADSFGYVNAQRRISSRILAAANIIANVSRRGRGNFVVTNTQIVTALQDAAGFVVAPMTNTLTQDGSKSLYFAGSVAGLNIYVDPNMKWGDTRVLVGRKGGADEPGVIFMPYILADTVQTIVEGTMAPKILINSRFAIVDAGFYPEQGYLTFKINGADALI